MRKQWLMLITAVLSFMVMVGCQQESASTTIQQATDQHITIIPRYNMAEYDQRIDQLYQQLAATPHAKSFSMADRVAYFSHAFLQQPYLGGPLGEGVNGEFDKSPLYRTDGFDCMTLASIVLALASSDSLATFKKRIRQVRYQDATVRYRNRNHFASLDWNPHNQQLKLLEDITSTIHDQQRQPVAKIATADIDKKAWYQHKTLSMIKQFTSLSPVKEQMLLQQFRDQQNYVANQQSHLPYIPLNRLFDENGQPDLSLFDQIPSGAVIEIVRPNWDLVKYIGTHLNVSHMGFAVREQDGRLMYREASSLHHQVINIPLVDYLKHYLTSPTVKGINVQRVLS